MRYLITGGGGFIGSHLSETLSESGQEVCVFDRPSARYLNLLRQKGINVIEGDLANPDDVNKILLENDIVFHLSSATIPQTSNDNPNYDVEMNLKGTLYLLEAARKAGVKKIIFSSSGGTVYGIPQAIPIQEDHPTEPINSYGICKLSIEKYLHLYWVLYGMNYSILRVSNAYGERQPVTGMQGAISAFLERAIHQKEITVWGDGTIMRDYIYITDIVNAFIKAAMLEGDVRIFNIGGGKGHSINDIITVIQRITRYDMQPKYLPGRLFDVPINILDISRARINLAWQPTVGLFEGVTRTYEWMLRELKK